ncbi:hypothetical protein [Roseovarius amoyensis]|uniref:hypothetical protein n=1 Tax=Roseovarius amoyensis TaxID=2211448 RepID=UPI0013A6B454|nr:hypothetical protein [Roseovarius amoyensis]
MGANHRTDPDVDTHGCPTDTHGCPADTHGCPTDAYGCPTDAYGCPTDAYGCPADTYGCPTDTDGCPTDTYGCPADAYGCPTDTHGGAHPNAWRHHHTDCNTGQHSGRAGCGRPGGRGSVAAGHGPDGAGPAVGLGAARAGLTRRE